MSLFGIAGLIRRARKQAGLTQRDLAAQLGVNPSAVAQWELGTNQPGVGHRIDLAVALNIRFVDLLPEVGDRVVLVTDPTLVAIVRLIEQEPPDRREALLNAIALLLERRDPPPDPAPPVPKRRRAKAR